MKQSTNARHENHHHHRQQNRRRRSDHHRQFPPNQGMLIYHPPPPPLPFYGFSSPSLLQYQNHPVLLDQTLIYGYQPYYSFIIGPLPYHHADFNVHYRRQQAANFVPRTWEYEENQRESVESSLRGGDWVQESDDPLSNIRMRVAYQPEEETAVFDSLPEELGAQSSSSSNGDDLSLEETILEHLKTRKYQKPLARKQVEGEEEVEICVVCQSEYENEELLGILGCGHEYHANCIERWLLTKNVCPVCKRTAIEQESWI